MEDNNNKKSIEEKIKEYEQQLRESNDNIDYDEVENYFKDEKNKKENKYNGINDSNTQSATTINTAFTKALEYTNQIKKDNMSFLGEIIDDLKKEIPRFQTVYERTINKVLLQLTSKQPIEIENNKIISSKFSSEEEKQLKLEAAKFWDQLNDIKKGLATAIAISAAAAGFWAVAWLGGISIPWAVAATTATATMGLMPSSLNIYLNSTNPYMDKILQGIAIFENAGVLIYQFVSIVINVFTIGTITLTGCSVLMPAFSAITALVGSLYYWVASTDIFKQLDTHNEFEDAMSKIEKGIPNYKFYHDYFNWNPGTRYVERNIELIEWTKYASSIDEFKTNSDNILFVNSKAFAGDDADFTQKDNILYKTNDIEESYDEEHKDSIVRKTYEPWCCCWFYDELFFNIYIYIYSRRQNQSWLLFLHKF